MRRFRIHQLLLAAVLAACSSTASTGGNEQLGASHLAIAAGDGQSASPGAALPIALQVVVEDSAGHGVAGVVVHFSVDSGGGSIAASSATTGGDGTASAGKWTLGAAGGMNVVSAAAGSLTAVKFHALAFGATARTIFANTAVGASGGTLTYTKAGDALNGLTITVPGAAFSTSTTWSVVADSSVAVHLPAEFSQVGPVLLISNGQGYADSAISLTMPMDVPLTDAVAPFYFDPATGTLEPITIVARNATSATLATRHFSVDLMAIPGAVPTSLRTASLRTFGAVHIIWVRLPAAVLQGTFTTGFQPLQDNWEFENTGDFLSARGDCEGMSITEIYYYYFVKQAGKPALYHHFDQSLKNPWDNVQGIRFAGAVQSDYDVLVQAGIDQTDALSRVGAANGVPLASLTASWVALTMKLTHQPVLMGLTGDNGGHAVVAFKITTVGSTATVFFADPNFPTLSRGMVFQGTQLQPIQMQLNSTATPKTYTNAYALGVTGELPLRSIDARWIEFLAKKAGSDHYPADYTFQVYDSLIDDYVDFTATGTATDTFRVSVPAFNIRLRCPSCPVPLGVIPTDLQHTRVLSDSGTTVTALDLTPVHLHEGANDFTAIGFARRTRSDDPNDPGFLDGRNFTVIYQAVKIAPADLTGRADTAYTFTATSSGLANRDTKFTWTFGDQTANVSTTGDSAVLHTFADTGKFVVRVQLRDASGILFGRDSTTVTISNAVNHAWQLTTATIASITPPSAGFGISKVDTLVTNAVTFWLNSLAQDPTKTTITVKELLDMHCGGVLLTQVGSSIGGPPIADVDDAIALVADNCVDPDHTYTGTYALGRIGAGTLIGSATAVAPGPGPAGGAINATMVGTMLTGTFHIRMDFTTGVADYAIQFTAHQLILPGQAGLKRPGS